MKKLFILAAIGEGATGLVLVVYPPIVTRLLFGADVRGAGMVMSRIAGIALIGLGVACWRGREAGGLNSPVMLAMLTYSLLTTIYLVYLGIVGRMAGILLWPAVAAHLGFLILVVAAWRYDQRGTRAAPRKAA